MKGTSQLNLENPTNSEKPYFCERAGEGGSEITRKPKSKYRLRPRRTCLSRGGVIGDERGNINACRDVADMKSTMKIYVLNCSLQITQESACDLLDIRVAPLESRETQTIFMGKGAEYG